VVIYLHSPYMPSWRVQGQLPFTITQNKLLLK
jgi:hypothetical protein